MRDVRKVRVLGIEENCLVLFIQCNQLRLQQAQLAFQKRQVVRTQVTEATVQRSFVFARPERGQFGKAMQVLGMRNETLAAIARNVSCERGRRRRRA